MNYKEFIDDILKNRGRFNCNGYKERHHIKPKCLGGSNDEENLIDLYAREHYEAHRLLAIENPNEVGLRYAWWMMSNGGGSSKKRFIPSAEQYEEARIAQSKFLSENFSGSNNPMYGVNRSGKNNPMYGVHRYGKLSPMYGKNHTIESKEKISKARINMYSGENHPFFGVRGKLHHASIPILQFTKTGTFVKEWESSGEVHRELGLDKSGIIRCCNHQVMSCGGFVWVKKEEYLNTKNYTFPNFKNIKSSNNKGAGHIASKSVVQLSKDGELIKIWDCISDAQKELNILGYRISLCCKYPKKHKTAGGYKWKYKESYEKEKQ